MVISTYEWPGALDAVLRGLESQTDQRFDVVVADDGSGERTEEVVLRWKERLGGRLLHVWQEDDAFRLARVRNLGATAAAGDSLVFIDGDCIPRRGFVHAVRQALRPGWFLAATRIELGRALSARVLAERSAVGAWSSAELLVRGGRSASGWRWLTPRDRRRTWRPGLPDFAPPGNRYGFCAAVRRADFEAVNGYDSAFVGWGDEDVDLAIRLGRTGLRCGYAGPGSTMLHLWHSSNIPVDRPNWDLLQATKACDRIEAVRGVRELHEELVPVPV